MEKMMNIVTAQQPLTQSVDGGQHFTATQMIIPPDMIMERTFLETPIKSVVYVERGTLLVYEGDTIIERIRPGAQFKVEKGAQYKFGSNDRGVSCLELYKK